MSWFQSLRVPTSDIKTVVEGYENLKKENAELRAKVTDLQGQISDILRRITTLSIAAGIRPKNKPVEATPA